MTGGIRDVRRQGQRTTDREVRVAWGDRDRGSSRSMRGRSDARAGRGTRESAYASGASADRTQMAPSKPARCIRSRCRFWTCMLRGRSRRAPGVPSNKVVPSGASRCHMARSSRHLARRRALRVRARGANKGRNRRCGACPVSGGGALHPVTKNELEIGRVVRQPREIHRKICETELAIESHHPLQRPGQATRVLLGVAEI